MFKKLASFVLAAALSAACFAQIPISNLPNAQLPLQPNDRVIVDQNAGTPQKVTRQAPVSAFTSLAPSINSTYILVTPDATIPNSRVLGGTANEVILADGGPLGTLTLSTPQPIGTLNTPTFAGLTINGTINAQSLILTNPLPATSGGTGFGSYTIGDILAANSATTLSKITDVAAGSYLRSGGVATLPVWSTLTLPNAATTGDLLMATGANAIGVRSAVAAGSYLRSAGAGVVPIYSTTTIPNTSVLGDIWYGSAANVVSALAGNITTTKQFLTQTGTGAVSAAPVWGTIAASDLPGSFSGFANPTGLIGLTAVNGVATTATRSDATHALDQSISPTWTGNHIFNPSSGITVFKAPSPASTGEVAALQGQAAGASSLAVLAFKDSGGTRIGYVGDSSNGDTNITLECDTSPCNIQLASTGTGSITGHGPSAGTLVDMTPDTGTFTATYTGFTAGVTCTATWARVGKLVLLTLCAATGTSNATTFTMTGLPAAITPATLQQFIPLDMVRVNNNSTNITTGADCVITGGSGTITFATTAGGSGWTAAGTKGFTQNINIQYQLN